MPGPFPGMDPYLEAPHFWKGAHNKFMTHLADHLNTLLPARYVADVDMRLYVEWSERAIYPDVAVLETLDAEPSSAPIRATAILEKAPWVVTVEEEPMREARVDIRQTGSERLVTSIEVLSPANKTAGSAGQRLYQEKQRELLQSDSHLIEIDLLRSGTHTVAPPRTRLVQHGTWDYLICLHRAGDGGHFLVWPNHLPEPLPTILVPLAEGAADLHLDLQVVFDGFYDAGAYARRIDYSREPVPSLTGEDAAWADILLREKGLR